MALKKPKRRARKPPPPTEHYEQCRLVVEIHRQVVPKYPEAARFYAVPNESGASRGTRVLRAMKMKEEGASPGVPDLVFPTRRLRLPDNFEARRFWEYLYSGLYLEMKRLPLHIKRHEPSDDQMEWMDYLAGEGFLTVCANGWQEGLEVVKWYFDLMAPNRPPRGSIVCRPIPGLENLIYGRVLRP